MILEPRQNLVQRCLCSLVKWVALEDRLSLFIPNLHFLQAKLKQLIAQALSLTSSSHAIASIQPTKTSHAQSRVLGTSAFDTLLTLRPAVLPNQSAAATRLISEGDSRPYFDQEVQFKERHTEDPRWQLFAILAERSTVREELKASLR